MRLVDRRIGLLFALFLLALLGGRHAGQVARHGQGRLAAQPRALSSRSRTSPLPAKRGTIFDRHGKELAVSEDSVDRSTPTRS